VPSGGRRLGFRVVLGDASGTIAATFYQTAPWLKARFPVGKKLVVTGEPRQSSRGWEVPHPETESAEDAETTPLHFGRIVPVYPGFERHEQRALRELSWRAVQRCGGDVQDPLPEALRARRGLLSLSEAVRGIHFPEGDAVLSVLEARRTVSHQRLAFDELFFLQLGLALRRQGTRSERGIAFEVSPLLVQAARRLFPFELTRAQARVVEEILSDMARPQPMSRLLQGDVGSGKTAVALVAAFVALRNEQQVAVMTPTELLAEQHHRSFSRWLTPVGARVALLTQAGTQRVRAEQRAQVASGQVRVVVGTQALIQGAVEFARLGLVIIDEQHRFGVLQRQGLVAKGPRPDVLVMTATPIPRTLAMTIYGDLDVSVLDELPPGRAPVETQVLPEGARARVAERLASELAKGRQAYVVYPLVEESESLELSDATQGVDQWRALLPSARIGLLHGRLGAKEKEAVMEAFRQRELDVLVSTTVVEVGVDVPNATGMVIEHSERFGLSQLHQLRGRVGRGGEASFCLLLTGPGVSRRARAPGGHGGIQ
jgi:ATP-dependent DNA helicase RecG